MAIIAKPYTFTAGTTAASAQVNADFDAIFNDYNGNITDANIAASGITTYGKVNAAALAALASMNTGAGVIPSANLPTNLMSYTDTGFKVGTITRAMDASSGDVAYTGLTFKPRAMFFAGMVNGQSYAQYKTIGFSDGVVNANLCNYNSASLVGAAYCIQCREDAAGDKEQVAFMKTFDNDGWTLSWVRVGATASATITIMYLAIK